MTLNLNCRCSRPRVYTYNVWLNRGTLENAKRHGIDAHGYTEETFNERVGKDKENFRKSIKTS